MGKLLPIITLALDNHNVTAMAGMSYTENNTDNVSASASGPNILSGYEPNFRYLNYVISNIVDGEEKDDQDLRQCARQIDSDILLRTFDLYFCK